MQPEFFIIIEKNRLYKSYNEAALAMAPDDGPMRAETCRGTIRIKKIQVALKTVYFLYEVLTF
jgi:hypothetical protein